MRIFLSFFLLVFSGVAFADYPAEWWEPKERKWSWEILPQEASQEKGEVILSKQTELGLLSNFSEAHFTLNGKKYLSLEGFWQMMKFPEGENDPRAKAEGVEWPFTREEVSQMIAFEAKDAGKVGSKNMKLMDINWVSFEGERITYRTSEKGKHYDIIYKATWAKVTQNEHIKKLLLQTGDLKLLPDHKVKPDASPAWKYFEILMDIREKLQRPPCCGGGGHHDPLSTLGFEF